MINYFQSFVRALGYDERRKARNIILRPGLQLRLPLYVLLLTFSFAMLVMLLGSMYFEQTFLTMLENTTQAEYLQTILGEQIRGFRYILLLLMISYILLLIAVTSLYTHKLIGPTIPIARHIKALQDGLYSHRVSLRKHDALRELAEQLNALAENLERRAR